MRLREIEKDRNSSITPCFLPSVGCRVCFKLQCSLKITQGVQGKSPGNGVEIVVSHHAFPATVPVCSRHDVQGMTRSLQVGSGNWVFEFVKLIFVN